MQDHLLTLNAGSSSIKAALFALGSALNVPARSTQIERIGQAGAPAASHGQALRQILSAWRDARIVAVGHRVVHGGTAFDAPVLIDDGVLANIAALNGLAPLHQPHNLAGIVAARAAFAGVPQVACFDTAFHRSMPEVNQRFALPQAQHDAGVRRYGFHGLSYESIRDQLQTLEPELARQRVVVAHLGNGASMCAMRGGQSIATTMSFSPLDGLPMGTRCGRLDAAVVLHLQRSQGMAIDAIEHLLYRESGLLGLSGLASDMRTLQASDSPAAHRAVDYFVEHVLRELAGMAAALRGIDAVVFTGGIGENAIELRRRIVEGAVWLGLGIDEAANGLGERCISSGTSAVQVRVMRTNEEAVIAGHAARVAKGG